MEPEQRKETLLQLQALLQDEARTQRFALKIAGQILQETTAQAILSELGREIMEGGDEILQAYTTLLNRLVKEMGLIGKRLVAEAGQID